MVFVSFSRLPALARLLSLARPSHSCSSAPPSRLPRSRPTTSLVYGVLAPSHDKGKFPAFSSNPSLYQLCSPLKPSAASQGPLSYLSPSRVFYRLHWTWNLASPNTLASASLPPSSPEKWTTVKRKFKQIPHSFPSHNRPHRPNHFPPSTPPNCHRSAGRAPLSVSDSCPLALRATPHAPVTTVPSPLVHVSRDDVSDLFASVPCPSSPPLISSSPDILSNSLPESGLSLDLPVLSVEPTAVFSLSEAALILPLLITFSPTPTLLPLSTLACTRSSSIVPSPALFPILSKLSPMVDALPSPPFVTFKTTLPLAPSSGAAFLLLTSPPNLLSPCYGRSALFLILLCPASFHPSCLVSPHPLLLGLQPSETYLALFNFFNPPPLVPIPSPSNLPYLPLLPLLFWPVRLLPWLLFLPSLLDLLFRSLLRLILPLLPRPLLGPSLPLGALSSLNFSSSFFRPSPPLLLGSSAPGWIMAKVALTR
ncbi:hypothetical protein AMTRI_Chr06g173540 [Amborella trichopoda]